MGEIKLGIRKVRIGLPLTSYPSQKKPSFEEKNSVSILVTEP
jgi:hypothetical protein